MPQKSPSVGHYEPIMFVKFLCFSSFTTWNAWMEQLFKQSYYCDPLFSTDSHTGLVLEQRTRSHARLLGRGTLTECLQPATNPQSHQKSTYVSYPTICVLVFYIFDPYTRQYRSKATYQVALSPRQDRGN